MVFSLHLTPLESTFTANKQKEALVSDSTERVEEVKPVPEYVQMYRDKGWPVSFPLPYARKAPPPNGVTGGIPSVSPEKVDEVWQHRDLESTFNFGLRMQTDPEVDFEVIGIDVDDRGSKRGWGSVKALQTVHGPLIDPENMVRSTRRHPSSPGGIYFFRVPRGFHWSEKPFTSCEVVQLTHRYAVVWPSKAPVDDHREAKLKPYRWLRGLGGDEVEIPHVDSLPWLPEAWQTLLKDGQAPEGEVVSEMDAWEAVQWLVVHTADFDQPMSPEMADKIPHLDDFISNAHGSAKEALGAVVHMGVHGHPGTKVALQTIRDRHCYVLSEFRERGSGERTASETAAHAQFYNLLGYFVALEQKNNPYATDWPDLLTYLADHPIELPLTTSKKENNDD